MLVLGGKILQRQIVQGQNIAVRNVLRAKKLTLKC